MREEQHSDSDDRSNVGEQPVADRPNTGRRKALGKLVYAAPAVAAMTVAKRADAQPSTPCDQFPDLPFCQS